MAQSPVDLKCTVNRTHVKANVPAILFLAIDLRTPNQVQTSANDRQPLNVGLAIDCSGSMQEDNKFEFAQQAASALVKSLRPADRISIVSFETKARVEVPSSPASDPNYLENAIAGIPLGQETDLYEGLRLAWEQILPNSSRPGVISRVILLTDGEPTHGKTKDKDFVALSGQIRQSGIPVTTVGVGPKYNETLLMNIAQATGSMWYHVSNPSYMNELFADEVTQMARTIVKSPMLTITVHEGTEIQDAYTMRPMVSRLSIPPSSSRYDFRLKDIIAGEDQTLFLRAKVPARGPGQYPLLRVQLGNLSSSLMITSTSDDQLAGVESDPYPRLLWVAGDGLTQVQRLMDGETEARSDLETRVRTLEKDPNLTTVAGANPSLDLAITRLREAHEETARMAPGSMNEDDKKQLRQDATVLRKRKK
jgi:Mg-chelatase subunit ChlD